MLQIKLNLQRYRLNNKTEKIEINLPHDKIPEQEIQ